MTEKYDEINARITNNEEDILTNTNDIATNTTNITNNSNDILDIKEVTDLFQINTPSVGSTRINTHLDLGYLYANNVGRVQWTVAGVSGHVMMYNHPTNRGFYIQNTLGSGVDGSFYNFLTLSADNLTTREFRISHNFINLYGRIITSCPTISDIQAVNATQTTNITNNANAITDIQAVNATQTTNITNNTNDIIAIQAVNATQTTNITNNANAITAIQAVNATQATSITSIQSVNNTQNSNISANAKIAGAFYRFQPSSTDMRFNGITDFDCNGAEVTGIKRLIIDPDTGTSGGGMIHTVGATDLRIHANFFGSSGGAIVLKTNLNSTGSSKDAKLTHADFNLNSRTITGCTNLDTITSNVTQLISDVNAIPDNLDNFNRSILIADDFAAGYISLQKTQTGFGGGPEWSNRSTNSYNSNDRAETQDSIAGHPGIVRLYIASSINDDTAVLLGLRRLPCTWGDTEKVEIIYMVPDGQSQYNFTVEIGFGESKDLNNSAIIRCQNNDNYTFEINRGSPSATSAVAGIRKNKWMMLTITNTGTGNCLFTLKNMTDNTTESYNYTGGALSMSALITPWVGLRNRSGTTPSSNRMLFVDYMSIRYKCANRT